MPSPYRNTEEYFAAAGKFQQELYELREICLQSALMEEFKWRQPCYSYNGANILILGSFKDSCILSFFKGALLKDELGLLEKAGENTQAARLFPFTELAEITENAANILDYIKEAIEVEKAGLKVEAKVSSDMELPNELSSCLNEDRQLKKAFESLTPGRQRAYIIYFSQAKQSETRFARIEKFKERILDGKGMNDCVCGLSRIMPRCDGSHRKIGV